MTPSRAAAAVVLALGISRAVAAQESRFYLGGAGLVSTQGSHRQGSSPSLPTTGADGTSIGVAIEAGGILTPHFTLGVEISLPQRFTSIQETDYLRVFQQESRHRDLAISGVFRVIANPDSRVRVAVVAGGGFVEEGTHQRRRDQLGLLPTFPPVFGPYSDEYSFTRGTAAAIVGGDVEFAIASHVAIVPQTRAYFIRRSDDPSQPGWALGLDSLVLRPAIGVRTAF